MLSRLVLALFVFTVFANGEDGYAIRLVRPMKAGDRFDVSAKVAFEDGISTSFDGAPIEENKTVAACRLTGELSILAVTSKGLPRDLRVKLKTVECVEDGKRADFFKVGDELRLRKAEPENVVEVNGEAAEDVQAQIIESLLSVEDEGDVTDDEIFGTSGKVKVGEEWAVNGKAAVADMARSGVKGLEPSGVAGRTKLVRVSTFEDRPALLLRVEMKVDGKAVSMGSLPQNVKATRFHSDFTEEIDLPTDPAETGGHTKGLVMMEVDATGKAERGGAEVQIGVKIRRRVATESTATPAK